LCTRSATGPPPWAWLTPSKRRCSCFRRRVWLPHTDFLSATTAPKHIPHARGLEHVERPASSKDSEPAEDRPLLRRHEVVAPGDGVAHAVQARWSIARSARQQRQAAFEPVQESLGWQHTQARGSEFNRKRQTVELAANVRNGQGVVGGQRELATCRCCAGNEQLNGGANVRGPQLVSAACQANRAAGPVAGAPPQGAAGCDSSPGHSSLDTRPPALRSVARREARVRNCPERARRGLRRAARSERRRDPHRQTRSRSPAPMSASRPTSAVSARGSVPARFWPSAAF